MRKIQIKYLTIFLDEIEYLESLDQFEDYLTETVTVKALEFFRIFYDEKTKTLEIPVNIDIDRIIEVHNVYLDLIEAYDEPTFCFTDINVPKDIVKKDDYRHKIVKEAKLYNAYTEKFRGADDGTYDYVGSYIEVILLTIQNYINSKIDLYSR